ncbi:MAG TPA: hypothetical protein PLM22_00915 [Candidatus Sabulitectum sp.]|nr:hypothetical protein [Candidatus Sabulitectum sp.]HPJ27461.1 hypothetical protein [Candidatus Sabulitectum sp.]HPR21314.1 hypothetical protein [Candidatus Sabulitectum sp.]
MKTAYVLLALGFMAFADNNGCTETVFLVNTTPPTDDISISVVNEWTLSGGMKALGLDVVETAEHIYVLGADNQQNRIFFWDQGNPAGSLILDAANDNCFGICWNNDLDTETYYTNDWYIPSLYYTEDFGSTWTSGSNPAGIDGRGMDFDGTNYWTTNGTEGGIWRFQPGSGAENIATPEVPSQPSGLAVFPYEGDLGIVITPYNPSNLYFYRWDGSALTYLGSTACPGSPYASYGLAYSENNGHLYWSCSASSGGNTITELSFTITSLSRNTWAGIKTAF